MEMVFLIRAEYEKKYERFKKNNLPTFFYNKVREKMEYVYYSNDSLNVFNNLTDALGDLVTTCFYYPFNCTYVAIRYENNEKQVEIISGHNHAHSFEEVVRELYYYPETFRIPKNDRFYYSEQELEYLNRVQKFLLFLGLKDIRTANDSVLRYRNKILRKYQFTIVNKCKNKTIRDIIAGKTTFRWFRCGRWHRGKLEKGIYNPYEMRALLLDEKDNVRILIEYTNWEFVRYKSVKDKIRMTNVSENAKIFIEYFTVIEIFD